MRNILLALTVICLTTSCASWMPRPAAPLPPVIDCSERAPAEPLPARPKFGSLPPVGSDRAAWLSYIGRIHALWGGYSVRMLGVNEAEVRKRAETAECLDRERKAGRLR